MKKSNTFLSIIFITIFVIGCKKETEATAVAAETEKNYAQLEKAKWFMDSWENLSKESNFREIWTQKNDSTYSGKSFVTVGKDTVFSEEVAVIERNDSLFYNVNVKGQNKDKPVAFYMTKGDEKEVVFENPKHDFPTKIKYTKITNDSIVATISGMQNGKEASESLPMKKSKTN